MATHWMVEIGAWKSFARSAIATFTIVVSRIDMNAPRITTAEIVQRRRSMTAPPAGILSAAEGSMTRMVFGMLAAQ